MTLFVYDTFTDTNDVTIGSHTGETGATWTESAAGSNATLDPKIASNNLVTGETSATNAIWVASGTPPSADYIVRGYVDTASGYRSGYLGILGRFDGSQGDGYALAIEFSTSNVICFRFDNGAAWFEASRSMGGGIGADVYMLELEFSGTTVTGKVQRASDSNWLDGADGNWVAGEVVAVTGTAAEYTAAGNVGVWFSTGPTGASLTRIEGDDGASDTTAPLITGPSGAAGAGTSSKSLAENITAVHTFTADEAVTWDLNGGADVARFSINPSTGALTFNTAPNYESPTDADTNNTYVVGVRATDGSANASTQTVTVTITNANEAPTFSGTISISALTEGVAMSSYATAGYFGDPDSGDTASYSAIGSWPAGITVNSSTGAISGTPTTAGTYANLQVRRTDSGALTIDSNTFTITVSAPGGTNYLRVILQQLMGA